MATAPGPADEPLDDTDETILSALRSLHESVDPVPGHLVDWVVAVIGMSDVDVEICRLVDETPAEVRGVDGGATTVTFQNTTLTIMLRIDSRSDGSVRVDGWLAPAGVCVVEIRTGPQVLTTSSDLNGRFAFDPVPTGLAHVVVRGPLAHDGACTTVTQSVVL